MDHSQIKRDGVMDSKADRIERGQSPQCTLRYMATMTSLPYGDPSSFARLLIGCIILLFTYGGNQTLHALQTEKPASENRESEDSPISTDDPSSKTVANPDEPEVAEKQVIGAETQQAELIRDVLLILGASGTPEYESDFLKCEKLWRDLATTSGARYHVIGLDESKQQTPPTRNSAVNDLAALQQKIEGMSGGGDNPLWIVLIGHGTYTRGVAKFNLRGPDVSAEELKSQLDKVTRPTIVLNFSSSSGPFINAISGENRVVVTATKSGEEQNYSRFGGFFTESILDPTADLDHDDQVSVLEAFLAASARTRAYYDSENRIMTEHALLDDNGDQLGTPSNFFRGIRATKKTKAGTIPDGRRSSRQTLSKPQDSLTLSPAQRAERDRYEIALDEITQRRELLSEQEYLEELEAVLVPLSTIYEQGSNLKIRVIGDQTE
jgi:hypothetical protein